MWAVIEADSGALLPPWGSWEGLRPAWHPPDSTKSKPWPPLALAQSLLPQHSGTLSLPLNILSSVRWSSYTFESLRDMPQ